MNQFSKISTWSMSRLAGPVCLLSPVLISAFDHLRFSLGPVDSWFNPAAFTEEGQ